MIGIIDYGMGNITSIKNMITYVGGDATIVSRPDDLRQMDKVIIPGVGAFDNGMKKLEDKGFVEVLNVIALEDHKPVLGICLGMQLITKKSDEGGLSGLGWLDAETYKMQNTQNGKALRIPHMGWNIVKVVKESPLLLGLTNESRFYFVHGYAVRCHHREDILSTCDYGGEVVAIVQKDNIYGVQFHPEKSHKFGMKLLYNFSQLAS